MILLIISIVASLVTAQKTTRYPYRYPDFNKEEFGNDPYGDERINLIHEWT